MTITISGSGTIGGPTTFTDNVTLGTSLLATPSGATPSYLCRAWVNFNGTGTVAIRASGNVSSITDGGTGNYTINFTTAMTDANYSAVALCGTGTDTLQGNALSCAGFTTTTFRVRNDVSGSGVDRDFFCVSIFR
jgi:hypothetical protein